MAPLILAALGLLLAPVFAAPPTCVDKASDGLTFTSNNYKWTIECDVDYYGNDLPATQEPTFESCINRCDANPKCVDVSYVGENCYMKYALAATANPQGDSWTAKRGDQLVVPPTGAPTGGSPTVEPAVPLSCIDKKDDGALYQTQSSVFKVVCGIDYGGNDLPATNTDTFEACIDACAAIEACVDVSYVWGACYMKNKAENPADKGYVWSAVRQAQPTTPQNPTDPSTPTVPTVPTEPLDCDGKKSDGIQYHSPTGGIYLIQCGIDYAGGDLDAKNVNSFEDCITACDNNVRCVDVAYVYGSCYLKSVLNQQVDAGWVWTAKVLTSAKDIFTFPTATPQDVGTGTETMMDLPIEMEPAPTATLAPVPPPGVNMGGLGVLTPDTTAKIWYNGEDSENEEGGATTVRLTIEYEYPSIILDNSMYIEGVSCTADGLSGRFDISETVTPYLYAISTWPQNSKVILITAAASCSPGAGQNGFFLAESIHFDDSTQTFRAEGALAELADLYTNLDIDFGTIVPDKPTEPEFDGTAACGSPDQTVLNGLPALACGPDFDKNLDKFLTFYSDEITDPVEIVAAASPETGLVIRGRPVRRRGWGSFFKAIVNVVKVVAKVVVAVAKVVVNVVVAVVQKAVEVVVSVAKKVVAISIALAVNAVKLLVFIVTGNYSNKLTLPVSLGPTSAMKTQSPWGPAVKFYTFKRGEKDEKWSAESTALDKLTDLIGLEAEPEPGVEMWCVNCGITGKIVAEGSISATPLSGLTKGTIGVSGNMYAGLYLGVNAFAKWEKTFEKELLKKGLPGWSIPGIVTLGPELTLSIEATIGVQAEGQLITGASLTWPAFEATLNFVDRTKSTRSGWTPVIDTKFQAHGSLEASAALGLPITVEFGIDILNGKFKKAVGLVDTPAVVATAEFSIDVGTDENDVGTDDCYGIGWDIKLTNEVKLEITDGPEFVLTQWASPALAEGCIGWPKPGDDPAPPTENPSIPDIPDTPDVGMTCPSAAGTTYTDVTNNNWEIRCDIDYPYNDMASNKSPTFEDCIASCGATTGCVGVSWIRIGLAQGSNTCYLKSAWGTARPANQPYPGSAVDTALMMSPFRIHSVMYSTMDITNAAIPRFVSGNRLIIDTGSLATIAGDPWPGAPKSISMLYSYGAEERMFNARDGVGKIIIPAGPINNAPNSRIVPSYPQAYGCYWLQIVGINYGLSMVDNVGVSNNLYQRAVANTNWQFTNALMGGDTWGGIVKTGVVWYRDTYHAEGQGRGDLYYMTARENQFGAWWRPFAKKRSVLEWSKPILARQHGDYNSTRDQLVYGGNNSTTWPNSTTPVATPLATPTPPHFSNSTVPASNSTTSSTTTTSVSLPIATPVAPFGNSTIPASNSTTSSTTTTTTLASSPIATPAAPFGNSTVPASNSTTSSTTTTSISSPIATPAPPFGNSTIPASNSTTSSTTTTPIATPSAPFGNSTVPASNSTTSSTTTISVSSPIATPAAPFGNSTVPASNSTTSSTTTPVSTPIATPAPPFSNSTVPASNTTIPSNGTSPDTPLPTPSGSEPEFVPVTVLDSTGILKMNPGTNGNLFLSDPADTTDISALTSTDFLAALTDSTIAIVGDSSDRLLHYYPSTMASLGASRVRLALLEEIPKGAKLIQMVQFDAPSGEKMLMGLDSKGNYFFLMLCSIQGQLNKIFLVEDVDAAPAVLQTEEAKFTITGGLASDCVPLAMVVQAQKPIKM